MHQLGVHLADPGDAERAKGVGSKHSCLPREMLLHSCCCCIGNVIHLGSSLAEAHADGREVKQEQRGAGGSCVQLPQKPHVRQLRRDNIFM